MRGALGFALVLGLAAEAVLPVRAAPPPPVRRRAVPSPAPVVDEGPLEAILETAEGSFVIHLLADAAPRHVRHFV
ncbi:MAG TPA: hypothetical protein VEQ84_02910, partial [Vicinamibacteria bacterium]|nr:hypothetical protein [Vicinamibacteria bacterium]